MPEETSTVVQLRKLEQVLAEQRKTTARVATAANRPQALGDESLIFERFQATPDDLVEPLPKSHKEWEAPKMPDDVSRYELDAKLESIAARMDARVAKIEAGIETITHETRELRAESRSTKWWTIGTGIAVVGVTLAALMGSYAANVALVQTATGAFESGRNTSQQASPPPPVRAPESK